MNYSKPMRVNYKRLLTTWIISLIVTSVITAVVTILIMKNKTAEATETEAIFYTPKVQEIEPTIIPKPTESPIEDLIVEEPAITELGEYTITAYCPCETCCGIWAKNRPNGIVYGAAGIELQEGYSVAAPGLPFGTILYIEGLGEYVVEDRPVSWVAEKYDGKIIDIYFNNHEDAKAFGLQHKEVFIMKGDMEND